MARPVFLMVLALFGAALVPLAAQQQTAPQTVAVLSAGPDQRRGIELFAPDLTPFWYGRYSTENATIVIRYT